MREQKHTKGPWVLTDTGGHDIATIEPKPPEMEQTNFWTVATVNRLRSEWRANARLIAAAPELKDAAQEVEAAWVELCRVLPQDDRIELLEWGAMQRLRAALSKATGQS